MRIRHLLLLAVLPFSSAAQTEGPALKPKATTELAFNAGYALDNAFTSFEGGGYLRGGMSLLKNRGAFQYGLTVEGGTNSNDQWYVAPGVVANYRSIGSQGYWYGGGMAGYNCSGEMLRTSLHRSTGANFYNGYVFGLQIGRVQQLGKRFSLTAEAAVRSSQNWIRRDADNIYFWNSPAYETTQIVVYIPVTVGFRYRL